MPNRRELIQGASLAAATVAVGAIPAAASTQSPIAAPMVLTGRAHDDIKLRIGRYIWNVANIAGPQLANMAHLIIDANNALIDRNPDLFHPDRFLPDARQHLVHAVDLAGVYWRFDLDAPYVQTLPGKHEFLGQIVPEAEDRLIKKASRYAEIESGSLYTIVRPFRWHVPLVSTGIKVMAHSFEPEIGFGTRFAFQAS